MRVLIQKVGVNLDSPDLKGKTTVEDLKKLEIFSHLTEKKQEESYAELLEKLQNPPEDEQGEDEEDEE